MMFSSTTESSVVALTRASSRALLGKLVLALAGCSASNALPAAPAPSDGGSLEAAENPDAGGPPDSAAPADAKDATNAPADAGDAGGHGDFVYVCGTSLCLHGQPFRIKGATTYGQLDTFDAEVTLAAQARINLLELVEFETKYHDLADAMSEATWTRVDGALAVAATHGLHVLLNFSSYGQSLAKAGRTPTTTDWQPYLSFVANRMNTVTHVRYADDPTLAMVELWGEIPPPNGTGTNGTPQQMTDFFKRSLGEWKALDANHLANTGGFSYLNEANAAGIDWKTIMADPSDDVCAVEINSQPDRDVTVPMVSAFCQQLGKPWFLSAWSACNGTPPQFSGDIDHYTADAQAALHAADMYAVAADTGVTGAAPSMAAVGSDFWNLGPQASPTCDVNPMFPMTFAAVQAGN
jgi:hypothetical protein